MNTYVMPYKSHLYYKQYNFEIWHAYEALNLKPPFIQTHSRPILHRAYSELCFSVWVQKRDGERWLAHLA